MNRPIKSSTRQLSWSKTLESISQVGLTGCLVWFGSLISICSFYLFVDPEFFFSFCLLEKLFVDIAANQMLAHSLRIGNQLRRTCVRVCVTVKTVHLHENCALLGIPGKSFQQDKCFSKTCCPIISYPTLVVNCIKCQEETRSSHRF